MTKPKNGAKKTKGQPQNRRKIGERTETVVEKLSPMQVDDARERVCTLMRSKEELEAKRKSTNADFKSKITEIDGDIDAALTHASTARRNVEITIEEWLTDQNEVIRVRRDSGEVIGTRNARIDELQESLPGIDDEDDGGAVPPEGLALVPPDEPEAEAAGDFE